MAKNKNVLARIADATPKTPLENIIAQKSTLIPDENLTAFDTKKADGEKETLEICRSVIGAKLPFNTSIYLYAFHASNRQEIVIGLKRRFDEGQFQPDNVTYFTSIVIEIAKSLSRKVPHKQTLLTLQARLL